MAVPPRRPQRLMTAVGGGEGNLTADNVVTLSERFDSLEHTIPESLIASCRSANPNIILLDYTLPHARQSTTYFPSSYYMRDTNTGAFCYKNGWYLLDFRQAVVRNASIQDIIATTPGGTTPPPAGLDGWFVDVSWAGYLNGPFTTNDWRSGSATGPVAYLGDLDGGWDPTQSRSVRPSYTDGTWPAAMLNFHNEFRTAVGTSKIRIYNGHESESVYNHATAGTFWQTQQTNYLAATSGTTKEAMFVSGVAAPNSETSWKFWLDRAKAIVDSGEYFICNPLTGSASSEATLRQWAFASYLLFADGVRAFFFIKQSHYGVGGVGDALYQVDHGTPDTGVNSGAYQVFGTPGSSAIYKRTFTRYRVWVNPGTNERTQDGKTLAARTALLELRADIGVPADPTNPVTGTVTATTAAVSITNPATNETAVEFEVQLAGSGTWQSFSQLADTTNYTFTSLLSDRDYSWRARNVNASGPSGYTTVLAFRTLPGLPATPTNHGLDSATQSSLRAFWDNPATNETSLEIQHRDQGAGWPGSPQITNILPDSTAHTIGGLTAGVKESQVRTVNASGPSPWSNMATGTVLSPPTVPPDPTNVTGVALAYNQIQVTATFPSPGEETSVEVQVRKNDEAYATLSGSPFAAGTTTYTYTDASPGNGSNLYWMRVRRVNAAGPSGWVESNQITTPPKATPISGKDAMSVVFGTDFSRDWVFRYRDTDESERLVRQTIAKPPAALGSGLQALHIEALSPGLTGGAGGYGLHQILNGLTDFYIWTEFLFPTGFVAPTTDLAAISFLQIRDIDAGNAIVISLRVDHPNNTFTLRHGPTGLTTIAANMTLGVRHTVKLRIRPNAAVWTIDIWYDGVAQTTITPTHAARQAEEIRCGATYVPTGWTGDWWIGRLEVRTTDFAELPPSDPFVGSFQLSVDEEGNPIEPDRTFQSSPTFVAPVYP